MAGANPIVLSDCMSRVLFFGCPMAGSDCCGGPTPTVPPPPTTTGGVGSPPPPTVIPGGVSSCGSCRKPAATSGGGGVPSTGPAAVTAPAAKRTDYPWWVYVLAGLILAQIVSGGNANAV